MFIVQYDEIPRCQYCGQYCLNSFYSNQYHAWCQSKQKYLEGSGMR